MTSKQVETNPTAATLPPMIDTNALLADLKHAKFAVPTDEDMQALATLRSTSRIARNTSP